MFDTQHIEILRHREHTGASLTAAEREELDKFYKTLEDEEAVYLLPAIERMHQHRIELEERIRQLESLRDQRQRCLDQMRGIVKQIAEVEIQEGCYLLASGRSVCVYTYQLRLFSTLPEKSGKWRNYR